MADYILALDQGTTSCRSILFQQDGSVLANAQKEFEQILPSPGHGEHDALEIWDTQLATAREVLATVEDRIEDVKAIGITNQRETTVVWDRATGKPVQNAIVWQSRITAGICQEIEDRGYAELIQRKTGLILDAYFSATKIKYILDQDPRLRERAEAGELCFGTMDSFLVWQLTGGTRHVTDYSNASRTMLFNIHDLAWDSELLELFQIPRAILPEVVDSSGIIGSTRAEWFGAEIPVAGIAGDQQAATFGQGCFQTGDVKNTYGTGSFILMNTGAQAIASENRLLTTIGWGINGEVTYCLEGAVFIAGAVVQWLRDGLKIIGDSAEVESLAAEVSDTGGVELVPAFVGLGAPHWDPAARGAILGITRGTTDAHIARAALDAIALQTCDVVDAMVNDLGEPLGILKVDGGASVNNGLMQFQADMLNVTVRRPRIAETTALGAAYLAGLAVGVWESQQSITANWVLDREFHPQLSDDDRNQRQARWHRAVARSLDWHQS